MAALCLSVLTRRWLETSSSTLLPASSIRTILFYNEEIAIEETLEFLTYIDAIDGEFANYLIANGMLKDASFPGSDKEEAHSLAQDNLDFLCRNLRRGGYTQE